MATLTITTTAAQSQRIATALGMERNLVDVNGVARDATAAEVKDFLIDALRRLVQGYEYKVAHTQVAPPAPMDPT